MSQEIHKSQLLLEETSKEEEGSDKDGNLCQICFDQKIQIAIEPCLHSFCHNCIYNWTKEHETCPLCRQKTKKVMSQEQQEAEARDALLADLTVKLRQVLDDEKKRLKANIELRNKMILESKRRDEEDLKKLRNSRR